MNALIDALDRCISKMTKAADESKEKAEKSYKEKDALVYLTHSTILVTFEILRNELQKSKTT